MKAHPHKLLIGLLIATGLIPSLAQALSSDQNLPARFVSDHVVFNHKTGITIFTGNVKMDQGTTHLTGDKVTSYSNDNGNVTKVVAVGKLAHYNTLPDGQEKAVDAWAETIEYYPQEKTAILIGNGKVTQGANSFTGPHIVYNMEKQTVVSTPTTSNTQSVIVLQPQDLPGKVQP